MCSSPGGWGYGDPVRVQVTFNGEDYSDTNFTFFYYKIDRAFPRSGPADGNGGPIRLEGSGFRSDSVVTCSLNLTVSAPLEVSDKVIKCPVAAAADSDQKILSYVPFEVNIDGNVHKFFTPTGFTYYPQIVLEGMDPHIGPSEGKGIIYYYGQNF
jgi:hypothetical protein